MQKLEVYSNRKEIVIPVEEQGDNLLTNYAEDDGENDVDKGYRQEYKDESDTTAGFSQDGDKIYVV